MRVLKFFWIDDMEAWTTSAQDNLHLISSKYGIKLHIVTAANGENVVQQLMQYDFDAVIMDYNMSPFNGDKYIKDIRYEDHLEHIPIIFYSQDTSTDLEFLVKGISKIHIVYRLYLEDKIKELFFKIES